MPRRRADCVARVGGYTVRQLSQKFAISPSSVRTIIQKIGDDDFDLFAKKAKKVAQNRRVRRERSSNGSGLIKPGFYIFGNKPRKLEG